MIHLPADPEAELLAFVRSRFGHIASGRWGDALDMLDIPDDHATAWTRERVLALVNETFREGTVFAREFGQPVFTAPETAKGKERHSFGLTQDGTYWLNYDVPLNEQFSDITAQFEFLPSGTGFLVVLYDFHVM